jgi:nucleoside-diphosphate-sugar epimerase
MAGKLNVVTGATGLLGSHIAEQLVQRGERVRALIRPSSDTAFLRQLGVEIAPGDLQDGETTRRAVDGADVVYHCAARVGDWGSWKLFRRDVIETARNLVAGCRGAAVGRLLHVSSVAVYGHPRLPPTGEITEEEPQGQHLRVLDHYCRAKIQAEQIARQFGPGWTIVRPTWMIGPRDRNGIGRILQGLRERWISLLGDGNNLLNIVYAGDVAEGAIKAANHPDAGSQVYHLSSTGEITQREFLNALTDALGLPRVTRQVSLRLARWGGFLGDVIPRLFRWKRPPYVSRYGIDLIARPARFSVAKARAQLDWRPQVHPLEGLRRTLDWYFQHQPTPATALAPPAPKASEA